MKLLEMLKASVQSYLDSMTKSNQKLFGGETPDCCKLSRQNNRPNRS